MRNEFYLSLIILCSILSQGIAVISHEKIDESSDLHIRKKRVINHSPGGVQPAHVTLSRHVVQIQLNDEYECTGTILQSNMILTTRTCIYRSDDRYTVLSGSLRKNSGTPHEVLKSVKLLHYDLALLKIRPPIVLSPSGNEKINLFQGSLPPHTSGLFSGWGCTNISPSGERTYPQHLVAALLPIIAHEQCLRYVQASLGHPPSGPNLICTLDPRRERCACYGDEGGPLVYGGKLLGIYAPIGRVHLGVHPDVFVDLTNNEIVQWIDHYKLVFENPRFGLITR